MRIDFRGFLFFDRIYLKGVTQGEKSTHGAQNPEKYSSFPYRDTEPLGVMTGYPYTVNA